MEPDEKEKANALPESVQQLLAAIAGKDENARGAAWKGAGPAGAAAVAPLAEIVAKGELEASRAAVRALWQITRYAGRPGNESQKPAVIAALTPLIEPGQSETARREALWMLSELAGCSSVEPIARLFKNNRLREDARCALERIGCPVAIEALRVALTSAPPDFKPALAHSLRALGQPVDGYRDMRLVPTKQTEVQPL